MPTEQDYGTAKEALALSIDLTERLQADNDRLRAENAELRGALRTCVLHDRTPTYEYGEPNPRGVKWNDAIEDFLVDMEAQGRLNSAAACAPTATRSSGTATTRAAGSCPAIASSRSASSS
jgi:hypothetical protein